MYNFENRVTRLLSHLSIEEIQYLLLVGHNEVVARYREEREQLLLEKQMLHYKSVCRKEVLEEHGITDPFSRPTNNRMVS